jgi:FKBP-type peptidyl-prolyl cis-trans isomerase
MRFKHFFLLFFTLSLGAYTHMSEAKAQTTPGGVRYEIIQKSEGMAAKAGQKVHVHYTGWLDQNGEPGKKFDSSVDRGTVFVFTLGQGQVIQGWDEGVAGMQIGEKRRLFIPAALGYGSRGAGADIPPGANLIFDVELIALKG